MTTTDIVSPVVERIYQDIRAIYADEEALDGAPEPRVTMDLPAADPEPNHVFVWGTARDFGVAGSLTNRIVAVTFHVWLTVVATGTTADMAADYANRYQSLALQIPLCDSELQGRICTEIGVPQVRESDAWADPDGRRHAGYLLDFEVSKYVSPDSHIESLIGE